MRRQTSDRARGERVPAATLVIVMGAGLAAALIAAAAARVPARDVVLLLSFSGGGAVAAGAVAVVALRALRAASLSVQAAVAGLAPVLAMGVGVAGTASAMFISGHDLHVLLVVLPAAGAVGVITALAVGRRVAAGAADLARRAHRIGDEDAADDQAVSNTASSRELADVAAQLDAALARLADSRERTAALERNRRELVAWVSHDLRTPLAGIRAMVEALEDGVVSDPQTVARYHATMRREADRLAGLVDDLFELSRLQAGTVSLGLEQVPLAELLSDAVAAASPAADGKGVQIDHAVDAGMPLVELSTPEMTRVVRNLLDNAIRHTPPGGAVRVEAHEDDDGGSVVVAVSDTCGGIPDADLPRVFELAYRGDSARTPGDGGAGLGLAIARGLVEVHAGDISVQNEGPGCTFTVRLPISAPR